MFFARLWLHKNNSASAHGSNNFGSIHKLCIFHQIELLIFFNYHVVFYQWFFSMVLSQKVCKMWHVQRKREAAVGRRDTGPSSSQRWKFNSVKFVLATGFLYRRAQHQNVKNCSGRCRNRCTHIWCQNYIHKDVTGGVETVAHTFDGFP